MNIATPAPNTFTADCSCGWHADTLGEECANAIIEAADRHATRCNAAGAALVFEHGHYPIRPSHGGIVLGDV